VSCVLLAHQLGASSLLPLKLAAPQAFNGPGVSSCCLLTLSGALHQVEDQQSLQSRKTLHTVSHVPARRTKGCNANTMWMFACLETRAKNWRRVAI
jgi:hypothetical protein